MISYLTGTFIYEHGPTITLDVRDVGYRVFVTDKTKVLCVAQENVSLYIHTVVREQNLDLYGFETRDELYFFEKLIDVSGIGPRSGLAIIGLASTDTLYQAIVSSNIEFLTSVSGIGKKTAERMCIELRDKLKDYAGNTETTIADGDVDVIGALLALGYSQAQARQAVADIDPEVTEINDRIKSALSHLS